MERSLDLTMLGVEEKVLDILKTEWASAGNIKVNTFIRLRQLVTIGHTDFLPAIVVHTSPARPFNFLGGFIPVSELTVWGVVPYVGTPEQRKALEVMAGRITGILLKHFKVEGYWSDLRLRETRVLNSNEQPPRWEACQVRFEVWGLPIEFQR